MARSTRKVPAPKARVFKHPIKRLSRLDGWENANTGLGILGRDKRIGATMRVQPLDQESCEEVWRGDDIGARMVEKIPDEMLREGFETTIEDDKELAEEIDEELRRIGAIEQLRTGLYYGRAYGGAGILLGADDGSKDLERPLAEDRIRSFDWLSVLTPRELQPVRYYSDPTKPRYGEISVYRLVPLYAPPGDAPSLPLVHESRIIRIDGVKTSRRATLTNTQPGWDDSIFVRALQVISDFQAAFQGAGILTQDFSVPMLKIKGLAKLLGMSAQGAESIAERAKALEASRSIARTAIIDAEEEYTRETTTVTGLAELLDKLMLRLAAAADMPVSLLMGQAPAGLNATGDSDIRWFYDQIASRQERFLLPPLKRIIQLIMLSKAGPTSGKLAENWSVKFHPLWQLTEKEVAETRKVVADTDQIYIANQVATPEEIARSRFGGDAWSMETQIDADLREEMAAEEGQQAERLEKEQPPPPVMPGEKPAEEKGGKTIVDALERLGVVKWASPRGDPGPVPSEE